MQVLLAIIIKVVIVVVVVVVNAVCTGSNNSAVVASSTRGTKPITPRANGEPLLKWSSSHSHSGSLILSQPVAILLVVWSANGNGSALT